MVLGWVDLFKRYVSHRHEFVSVDALPNTPTPRSYEMMNTRNHTLKSPEPLLSKSPTGGLSTSTVRFSGKSHESPEYVNYTSPTMSFSTPRPQTSSWGRDWDPKSTFARGEPWCLVWLYLTSNLSFLSILSHVLRCRKFLLFPRLKAGCFHTFSVLVLVGSRALFTYHLPAQCLTGAVIVASTVFTSIRFLVDPVTNDVLSPTSITPVARRWLRLLYFPLSYFLFLCTFSYGMHDSILGCIGGGGAMRSVYLGRYRASTFLSFSHRKPSVGSEKMWKYYL